MRIRGSVMEGDESVVFALGSDCGIADAEKGEGGFRRWKGYRISSFG
jgi:hypothetical protein